MAAWILETTLFAGLLAVFAHLCGHARRLPPGLCHLTWLIVLLRLLVPPGLIYWPCSLSQPPLAVPIASRQDDRRNEPHQLNIALPGNLPGMPIVRVESPPIVAEEARFEISDHPEPPTWVPDDRLSSAALLFWVFGSVAILGRCLREGSLFNRVIRLAELPPPSATKYLNDLARRMALRPPLLRFVPTLDAPVVVGLWRPTLLWPNDRSFSPTDEGGQAILVHELAHLSRLDHWTRALEIAAGIIWWWHPLFDLVRRRLRFFSEFACDAWVLSVLPRARRAYATALLHVCEAMSLRAEPSTVLGVRGGLADLKRRIEYIMAPAPTFQRSWYLATVSIACALVTVPSWSARSVSAQPRPGGEPSRHNLARPSGVEQTFAVLRREMNQSTPDDALSTYGRSDEAPRPPLAVGVSPK